MRGLAYSNRKKRLLALALALAVLFFFNFHELPWVKRFAENKVTEFMGHRLGVRIGDITGGVFRDMILQNVTFFPRKGEERNVFRLERMEISYRIWDVIMEKLGFIMPGGGRSLKYIGAYFSEENPFVKGFIKLYKYPEKIELFGHISPVVFQDERKRGIKGVFLKRKDGKYDCELLWDGSLEVTGTLDPLRRAIELGFAPLSGKKGKVKLSGAVDDNGGLQVYSRLDKVSVFGTEVIGDIWISCGESKKSAMAGKAPLLTFSVKAENLVVNKRPFWDFIAEGRFSSAERTIFLDNLRWGEGFILTGDIGTDVPYPSRLKLSIKNVELEELARMMGDMRTPFLGKAEGEIDLDGPIRTAAVKGRLYIGEGVLNNMEFRSMFATLKGKLPVVRVIDSRVVKEGGHIIVSGEMDFSKFRENKVFENLLFKTDNKVAVWDDWQISKEEEFHVVEARKDRVTLSTSIESDSLPGGPGAEDPLQKEMGFKYELDPGNSIKLEFEEEEDFLGLEHKVRF